MADNVPVTPGSGKTIATDEVTDGTLGTVQVQFIKLMDGTLDSTNKLSVSAAGAARVDGSAVTQPISAASLPLPSGASTSAAQTTGNNSVASIDTKTPALGQALAAASVPVVLTAAQLSTLTPLTSVTVTQGTGTNLHTVVDSGTLTAVTAITNALPAGTNVIGHVIADSGSTTAVSGNVTVVQGTGSNLHAVIDSGTTTVTQATGTNLHAVIDSGAITSTNNNGAGASAVNIQDGGNSITVDGTITANAGTGNFTVVQSTAANLNATVTGTTSVTATTLVVTGTAAAAAGVTVTLPAVASQFHYITCLEIMVYNSVARTGSATPVLVTTTNLPGSLAYTFGSAGAVGSVETKLMFFDSPLKSSVANTATTIVCPATTSVIWRVNVYYYAAV